MNAERRMCEDRREGIRQWGWMEEKTATAVSTPARRGISCKIVKSSMKFKLINKISIIEEKFLVYFNLLRGPDITRSGAGSGHRPRVVHPCLRLYPRQSRV